MARRPNLEPLNAAIRRAKEEQLRSLRPGARDYPLPAYLDERGEQATWLAVEDVQHHALGLYNRYFGEDFLRDTMMDIVAEADGPVSFDDLKAELEQRADAANEWLVAIPLTNLLVPGGYQCIEQGHAALEMSEQKPLQNRWDHGADGAPPFTIEHDLGDKLDAGLRWTQEEEPQGLLDTRMTAKLFVVQQGTQVHARHVALTKARYALAVWCLLDPPDWTLWPATGEWLPRPSIHTGIVFKPYNPGPSFSVETGKLKKTVQTHGRYTEYLPEYTVTDQIEKLRAPFDMMKLDDALAPRAVLSAAWALHLAERQPGDQQRTDALSHLRTAIESICDIGAGPNDRDASQRWARITDRLGIWDAMSNRYTKRALLHVEQLTKDLRNITQHGSDDVLVNLGYPHDAVRPMQGKRTLTGEQLGLAQAAGAQSALHHAVREVIKHVAIDGITNGWGDDRFRQLFASAD